MYRKVDVIVSEKGFGFRLGFGNNDEKCVIFAKNGLVEKIKNMWYWKMGRDLSETFCLLETYLQETKFFSKLEDCKENECMWIK